MPRSPRLRCACSTLAQAALTLTVIRRLQHPRPRLVAVSHPPCRRGCSTGLGRWGGQKGGRGRGRARGRERSRRCGARQTRSERGQIFGANVHSCSSACTSSACLRAYRSTERGRASCSIRPWSPRARDRDARLCCAPVRAACNAGTHTPQPPLRCTDTGRTCPAGAWQTRTMCSGQATYPLPHDGIEQLLPGLRMPGAALPRSRSLGTVLVLRPPLPCSPAPSLLPCVAACATLRAWQLSRGARAHPPVHGKGAAPARVHVGRPRNFAVGAWRPRQPRRRALLRPPRTLLICTRRL